MERVKVEHMMVDQTSTTTTSALEIPAVNKSFCCITQTSAGAGTADCDIEGSNDGVTWHWVADASDAAVSTSLKTTQSTINDSYKYYRVNLWGITGTNCTVNVFGSFLD